ncbi:MAG: substrate-binding domain-containing protein, partial [Angelakisella sp.]
KKFTAAICGNDLMALGAIRAFNEKGFRVPEDISVMGFDGIEMGRYWEPSLTTMSVDKVKFGRRAFDLLYSNIVNGTTGFYKNELTLIEGGSTARRSEQ